MLTPSDYSAISDPVRKVLSDLNDQILADAARRIRKAGEMTNSAEWQLVRLQELGMSAEEVKAAVAKAAGLTGKEVDAIYTEAAKRSSRFDNEIMQKMGLPPVDPAKSPAVQQFIQAAKKQTNGELGNITRSMGFVTKDGRFKALQTAYQDAMDFTQFQVSSGAMTADEAVKMAVKDLADSGLRVVDYASGVRSFIEVAARRAVVTGVGQVVGKISEANADALGTNYVEVTAHAGARPEHAAWQGKVYCRVGSEPGYPNLVEATGYGTVGGLKGANCRHDFFPFIPGVSQRAYTDEQLKSIDPAPIQYNGRWYTYYEATQRQRQIESAMRQSKRRCVAYDAAGLKDDYTAEAARLQSLRTLYADFSKKAGLVTQNQRAQVAGFGKSAAGKARAAAKNTPVKEKKVVPVEKPAILQVEPPSDVDTFKERLLKQPNMGAEYATVVSDRFAQGSDTAKAAFIKYVPTGSVELTTDPRAAYYWSSGRIRMDFAGDLKNPRGPGATWYHEHGHLVDHRAGGGRFLSELHPEFQAAIESDWKAYCTGVKKTHGVSRAAEVYAEVSREIMGDEFNAVSDIIGGLTKGKCQGRWGHSVAYWKRDPRQVGKEAFAHFYEAQFGVERYQTINRYFPTAMGIFEKLLEGAL